jgi:hypothetical protein
MNSLAVSAHCVRPVRTRRCGMEPHNRRGRGATQHEDSDCYRDGGNRGMPWAGRGRAGRCGSAEQLRIQCRLRHAGNADERWLQPTVRRRPASSSTVTRSCSSTRGRSTSRSRRRAVTRGRRTSAIRARHRRTDASTTAPSTTHARSPAGQPSPTASYGRRIRLTERGRPRGLMRLSGRARLVSQTRRGS